MLSKERIDKFLLKILLLVVFVISLKSDVFASDKSNEILPNEIEEILENLSELNIEFTTFIDYSYFERKAIKNYEGIDEYSLYKFFDNDLYIGYLIWNDKENSLCEISKSFVPYDKYLSNLDNSQVLQMEFLYENGNYAVIDNEYIYYFNEAGEVYNKRSIENEISLASQLPNLNPQLQNSSNCIVAAAANVLFYYSENGYSFLGRSSFEIIKAELAGLFGYTYTNNKVPLVLDKYVKNCTSSYQVDSTVYWKPDISVISVAISNKNPCMVGFAAGSGYYSDTEGHMTMCCGYQYAGGGTHLIAIADGWSESVVYKTWSAKYNDCVITVALERKK